MDDDEGDLALADGLAGLAGLSTGRLNLAETQSVIGELSVLAVGNAEGAGVTVDEAGQPRTMVAGTDAIGEIERIQHSIGEGPGVTGAGGLSSVVSGSLGQDARWPRFGPRAARLGLHSVLSLPLQTPSGVLGVMNLYGTQRDAFGEHAVLVGERFGAAAAVAIENAQLLAEANRLAGNLQAALISRAVIDQALGIIMSRTGCTADVAFDRLRTRSQSEHAKVSVVAQSVVDAAVRRARARRAAEGPRGS